MPLKFRLDCCRGKVCRELCTTNFIFYNTDRFFVLFSRCSSVGRWICFYQLYINNKMKLLWHYIPFKLSKCVNCIVTVLSFVSYCNIKYKMNVVAANMQKLLFWFNVGVSTLNMQNVLYFCVLLANYSRKQSENCRHRITIFLKLLYTKNVNRHAKIIR